MKVSRNFALILIWVCACSSPQIQTIFLGQGIMSGEVTATSVILQTRFTASDTLVNDNLQGISGLGRFEIDTDPAFSDPMRSELIGAAGSSDFIIKTKMNNLKPATSYYYRVAYGEDQDGLSPSNMGTFKTLPGPGRTDKISFVVVTGMNYNKFHYGNYDIETAYSGTDKNLGYPALKSILDLKPDYFIGTGDNVYFDHPNKSNYQRALDSGKKPDPGRHGGAEVTDETGMRKKYHEQFMQPRFKDLFKAVGTYWEKDDHDYRFNDADPVREFAIPHDLGIKNFREQLPVVDPADPNAKTYRTYEMSDDLQIWFLEGRDYRSSNTMEDGPEKTLLGKEQIEWLKNSLLASAATFKFIISPTPMVGPDDAYKSDNHVNQKGFRTEGDALFSWLKKNGFLEKNLFIVCGDRHWQYHATHPSGFEEFSTGALVDNNSRAGRLAGDPNSTDTDSTIVQHYIQGSKSEASGGFLSISVSRINDMSIAQFNFYDEHADLLHEVVKEVQHSN